MTAAKTRAEAYSRTATVLVGGSLALILGVYLVIWLIDNWMGWPVWVHVIIIAVNISVMAETIYRSERSSQDTAVDVWGVAYGDKPDGR